MLSAADIMERQREGDEARTGSPTTEREIRQPPPASGASRRSSVSTPAPACAPAGRFRGRAGGRYDADGPKAKGRMKRGSWMRELARRIGAACAARFNSGLAPLHMAMADNPDPWVVEVLIEVGEDPNARDKKGRTPLHGAAMFNANPSVVEALIEAGADPNARAKNGLTPLHVVLLSRRADPSVVEALIEGGADPNARDKGGMTPLHIVASGRRADPSVVEALIEGGADPNARNEFGQLPSDCAKQGTDVYRRLSEARFE